MNEKTETATQEMEVRGSAEERQIINAIMANESLMRTTLLNKLIDPRRDIDEECGYPKELTAEQYRLMYDREGVSARVVNIFPEECWAQDPEVVETEDPEETAFESAFKDLEKDSHVLSYLAKADQLSGVGQFGILLLGLDDGLELNLPVEGIDEKGEKIGKATRKLLFLRAFDESLVKIEDTEQDLTNPRYSHPTFYSIKFESDTLSREQKVHWTRVVHLADNRESSEVYGVPRMQRVFNRLYDIRKTAGGSGEMFWKGGFPGYAFEMDPNARPMTDPEKTGLREELAAYANGLQRYLAIQGVSAKSLSPQVANPSSHIEVQLDLIAISLGVPKRIFMGSEQAQLASGQDRKNWGQRVARRREKYLTPFLLRPFIDRMIAFGILPEPVEYTVEWPDIDSPSEQDQALVLKTRTEALAKYVGGNVDQLIPPEIYLSMIVGMTTEEVEEIIKAVEEREKQLELEAEEERKLLEEEQRLNPPPVPPEPGAPPAPPVPPAPPPAAA